MVFFESDNGYYVKMVIFQGNFTLFLVIFQTCKFSHILVQYFVLIYFLLRGGLITFSLPF